MLRTILFISVLLPVLVGCDDIKIDWQSSDPNSLSPEVAASNARLALQGDASAAVHQCEEHYADVIRSALSDEGIRYVSLTHIPDEGVVTAFPTSSLRAHAHRIIAQDYPELSVTEYLEEDRYLLRVLLGEAARRNCLAWATRSYVIGLRKWIEQAGLKGVAIRHQLDGRILIALAEAGQLGEVRDLLDTKTTLALFMVDDQHSTRRAVEGQVPTGFRLYRDRAGLPILLREKAVLTGDHITRAARGFESKTGAPALLITLSNVGARILSNRTKREIGKPIAMVLITEMTLTELAEAKPQQVHRIAEEVISVAVIQEPMGQYISVAPLESMEKALDLAALVQIGARPPVIRVIAESTGPFVP